MSFSQMALAVDITFSSEYIQHKSS